jgi:acetoin utilization deacetylase AcuC-like enzyme
MNIPLVYHASYSRLALPSHHRFPVTKYQDLYQYLLDSGLAGPGQFHQSEPVCLDALCQIHAPDYVQDILNGTLDPKAMRRIGFPWSEDLVSRTLHSVGGTALTARLALDSGIALHLSGGYHHAHHDFGSGYCLFNDLVFAAWQAIDQHGLDKVLIFDCDVHQGDGSATLSRRHAGIISSSLHCQQNFPARKQDSHYDIELPRGTHDETYLETVSQTLAYLIRLEQPDLILYDAGVDIHTDDSLGQLAISDNGLLSRDLTVLSQAKAASIPLGAVIGGGYSKQRLELIKRHSQLFIAANQIWS